MTSSVHIFCTSDVFKLRVISATVYRSHAPGCLAANRSVGSTTATACVDYTYDWPVRLSTNSSVELRVPVNARSSDSCWGYHGDPYVVVTYRCVPLYSHDKERSALAVSYIDNRTQSSSQLQISDPLPQLQNTNFNLDAWSSAFCSLHVPRDLDVEFSFRKHLVEGSTSADLTSCDERVELWDGADTNGNRSSDRVTCRDGERFVLRCSGSDRFIKVSFVNDRPSVIYQTLTVRVRREWNMTIQCGYPSFPLFDVTDERTVSRDTTESTLSAVVTSSTTTRLFIMMTTVVRPHPVSGLTLAAVIGLVVGCVVAALLISAALGIGLGCVCCAHRKSRRLAERSSSCRSDVSIIPNEHHAENWQRDEKPEAAGQCCTDATASDVREASVKSQSYYDEIYLPVPVAIKDAKENTTVDEKLEYELNGYANATKSQSPIAESLPDYSYV